MPRKLSVSSALSFAALVLAQVGSATPSIAQTYLGTPTPAITGTRTPEQSPATAVQSPAISAPSGAARAGTGPAIEGSTSAPSPGLSFGAAPAPIVSPNR
jgi:hypothetical protein